MGIAFGPGAAGHFRNIVVIAATLVGLCSGRAVQAQTNSVSILDYGGTPDWTTDSATPLRNAISAAQGAKISVVTLDAGCYAGCTPPASPIYGSGYYFGSTITVPAGIMLYCPGAPYAQPGSNNFQAFPNAVILPSAGGMKFSAGSGYFGNCNFLSSSLAYAASPPIDEQGAYARRDAFATSGTAITCVMAASSRAAR